VTARLPNSRNCHRANTLIFQRPLQPLQSFPFVSTFNPTEAGSSETKMRRSHGGDLILALVQRCEEHRSKTPNPQGSCQVRLDPFHDTRPQKSGRSQPAMTLPPAAERRYGGSGCGPADAQLLLRTTGSCQPKLTAAVLSCAPAGGLAAGLPLLGRR
jgi:hypothetical protein